MTMKVRSVTTGELYEFDSYADMLRLYRRHNNTWASFWVASRLYMLLRRAGL